MCYTPLSLGSVSEGCYIHHTLIALCATLAKMAPRSSWNSAAPPRAIPSNIIQKLQHTPLQPSSAPRGSMTIGSPVTFKLSTACLNRIGTCTLRSCEKHSEDYYKSLTLDPTSSPIATTTRVRNPGASFGQRWRASEVSICFPSMRCTSLVLCVLIGVVFFVEQRDVLIRGSCSVWCASGV